MPIQHEGNEGASVGGSGVASLPARKLDAIRAAIAAGSTVYLSTYTRATKITPKVWARFEASGRPVLKVSKDTRGTECLWLASGRRYVCADLCKVTLEDAS